MNSIIKSAFIDEMSKLAEFDELKVGFEVEHEHLPTVNKIKASIKDGKITMSNDDIYRSIRDDHLNETSNPKRKFYYKLLKAFVDKG